MKITFIGHGYVGLVTGCVFADFGNDVYIVGHTKEKIERLKKGDPLIYEPGLAELLKKNLQAKRIHFTLDFENAVSQSDVIFITVGTPPKPTGEADLTAVFDVSRQIAKFLKKNLTVISCKSTVPVGTNKKIETIINKHKPKYAEIAVASVPEFLREGTAIHDTLNPDRVVIGSNSKKAIEILLKLHEPLNGKRIITDLASAELIKYTANAMLATKISFANLISFYCEKTNADVESVLDAVGLDRRIGRIFMNPGIGYGGSCLPKDVKALIQIGKNLDVNTNFLNSLEEINSLAQKNFVQKIKKYLPGKKLAVWGLSFKPNTDDIRESPALNILHHLLQSGFQITAYDPVANENVKKIFNNQIKFAENIWTTLKDADGLAIFTEWNEFKQVDLTKLKKYLKHPIIFDGRNIYDPPLLKKLGFKYFSVGRKTI
jgi:UDPglucose 6-dehydrogenase